MQGSISDQETLDFISGLTLLCVEDNKTTQLIYNTIFDELFYDVVFANDGQDGYEKYTKNKIDIVVCDYDMPKLNGLEMIEKIRNMDKDIPIILVSGIESISVITKALQLGVNNFIKKPIEKSEVLSSIESVSKLLIANIYLQTQRDAKLRELEKKEAYSNYQEDLGFMKELNILRNDFYYQYIEDEQIGLVDFVYQPIDVISGDAYSARKIGYKKTFYLMVDGMGKGLSASLSTMIITSFVNYTIDKMLQNEHFDFEALVNEALAYIRPVLLDEELLSLDFILIDMQKNVMHYSMYSMPAILMQSKTKSELIKIRSNNPPMSKWLKKFNIDSYKINDVVKYLICSDGLVENTTAIEGKLYSKFIQEDFQASFTKEDFKNRFFSKIKEQEDDITLIFIHNVESYIEQIEEKVFDATLENVDEANEWYSEAWKQFSMQNEQAGYRAGVVFTELFMNAYEHGSLDIDSATKHKMLDYDIYFDVLLEKEKHCAKKIFVCIYKLHYNNEMYIITTIKDEGKGFDTNILSEIFRNSATFNGRGVFVSRTNSLGIYYNRRGSSVLYLNKISKS